MGDWSALWLWGLPAAVVAAAAGLAHAGEPPLMVAPGSVVRWQGAGTETCAMGDRRWAPLGDACWYPVDLAATGTLEVARIRDGQRETALLAVGPYPYPEQHLTVPDSQVHLSPRDAARAERESAQVSKLWERPEGMAEFRLPLAPPLDPLPAGGRFGARRVLNGEPRSPHTGVDLAAPAGKAVHAAAAGKVVLVADYFFSGNSVFLDHGDGLITMYFHLSRADVHEGETVRRGQVIGAVGSTGRATGPHLHFGVRWHGARIDPEPLLGDPAKTPEITR